MFSINNIETLASLRDRFDIIVIDTPPALDFLLTTALIAANWYIIPVFPSRYDLDGLSKLTTTVKKVRERANAQLQPLGVVLGNVDAKATLDKDIFKLLEERFGDRMCQTTLARGVKYREATAFKKTIYEHAPSSPAAKSAMDLTREILKRLQTEGGLPPRNTKQEAEHG